MKREERKILAQQKKDQLKEEKKELRKEKKGWNKMIRTLTKKGALIGCIILLFISCTKQDTNRANNISFKLDGQRYDYSNVSFSSQPFCGKIWYSIEGTVDSTNIFLINLITDSLHTGIYTGAGMNLWTHSLSGISTDFKINITAITNGFAANFSGTLESYGKKCSITNGSIFINNN